MASVPPVNQVRTFLNTLFKNIDNDLNDFVPLVQLSQKYNVRTSHAALGVTGAILMLALFDILPHTLTILLGLLYPAYMSLKAMHQGQQNADWLAYWLVFGFLTAFDRMLRLLLFFLPGYYALKGVFFIWLFYPKTHGITLIYQQLIKPQFLRLKELSERSA